MPCWWPLMREKQLSIALSHFSVDMVDRKAWAGGQAGYVIMMRLIAGKTDIHGNHCRVIIDVRKAGGEDQAGYFIMMRLNESKTDIYPCYIAVRKAWLLGKTVGWFLSMSLTGLRQVSLPLHGCKVQFRPSAEESSGHNFPPCSGSGFVQDRVRNWKPVPQVTLHFVQFDQLEKPPSTTNKTKHTTYSMIVMETSLNNAFLGCHEM